MTYTLTCTGSGGGANGTVAVAVNQPPVANNRCFSIQNVDQSVGVTLSASDPNGNNTISSYTVPAAPSNGTIMECAGYPCTRSSPSFTYVPPNIGSSRRGMDKFTFTVTDSGALGSSTGTVTILNNGKLRIMPLGDSITFGTTVGNGCSGGDGCPEDGFVIGYRKKLLDDLTAQSSGYIVDFVGSQDEGGSVPIADTDHEGHGGFRDDQINSGISGWLNSNPPDVILLHIGTNGLNDSGGTNAADVANILTTIDNWENSNYPVTVFLARIIKWVDGNSNVATFNNNLTTMVSSRPNDRVVIVDQNSALNNILNQDMADNLHPNQTGYDKMATKWLSEMTLPANVSAKYLGLPACQ